MKTKSKVHPWKEIRQTRGVRFTDSEWDAIMRAARAAKTTPSGWLRYLAAKALGTLTLLVVMLASCGGRTDLLEDDVGGKQPLWIPLAGGLQTDIDDRLVPLGRALDITNMQIDQQGKLVKRFGHTQASTFTQPGSGGLPTTWQLASLSGAKVSISGSPSTSPVATYSPNQNAWNVPSTDKHSPLTMSLAKLPSSGGEGPMFASGGGYYYVLYHQQPDSTNRLMRFDVIDSTTKKLVTRTTFTASNTVQAWDIAFCNGLAVAAIAVNATNVTFLVYTPSTTSFSVTPVANVPSGGNGFDMAVKDATTVSVAYASGTTGNVEAIDFVPSTLAATTWTPKDSTAASIPMGGSVLSWVQDYGASGKIALATISSAQGARMQWDFPAVGATRQATTTYNADPAATTSSQFRLTAHTTGNSATGDFQMLWGDFSGGGVFNQVNSLTRMAVRAGGVLTTGFNLFRSITPLSKTFTYAGDFYAMFSYGSPTDGNSYVMRIPAVTAQPSSAPPQAIFGVGSTGNYYNTFTLANATIARVAATGSTFVTAISYINRIGFQASTAGGVASTMAGVELATVSFISNLDPSSTGRPIEAIGSLFIPGGAIKQFDGAGFAEMGFAYQPPAGTLTPGAVGSMTPSSTYSYSFVWVYLDAQGLLWRSAPSVTQSVVLGGGQNSVTVGVPTLRVTGHTAIGLEVYRGAANDNVALAKLTQLDNSLSVDTVSFVDTIADTAVAGGEPLYTNGTTAQDSPLPNATIPGSPFVFTFQGRLCFISADDPTELWFSNISTPKNGVRFNTQNVVRFADERGGLYGAAAMDDKVVAFKSSGLYAFSGEGPDDAGNGSFSTPQLIALGVGSTQPRSIVPDKDGIYFMSTAKEPGIQKVNRGLSLAQDKQGQGFGAAVQRYAGETIMSSVLVPEQSQVRFYCQSGRVLVYDLVAQLWTTFQLNLAGDQLLSAIALNGAALVASNGFGLFQEDVSGATYFDGNSTQGIYAVTVTTPWLEFSAIKGFGRLSELIGTGKTVGDHTLTGNMYTDFDDNTIVNTKSWNETVVLTPRWNWEWVPRVQRMSAAKITLTETSTTAGFQVEGITAWIGVKPGLARQPTTTRGP